MKNDFSSIAEYWKSAYSSKIESSQKLDLPEYFEKMAGLMAPGNSFFYVVNFHTLELELISDSITEFLGVSPKEVDMNQVLSLALPEEIDNIRKKERVIKGFYIDYLEKQQVMDYKVMYTYRCRDYRGQLRTMLHQASALSATEEERFVHVFSIHTDISHLSGISRDEVSFIHINGGKGYFNISTKSGKFDPRKLNEEQDFRELLSNREIAIVQKMANGLNSDEVARSFSISPHTVQTHRRNILKKTHSKNSLDLISKCIATGIISPLV